MNDHSDAEKHLAHREFFRDVLQDIHRSWRRSFI